MKLQIMNGNELGVTGTYKLPNLPISYSSSILFFFEKLIVA
jgi:hypothetical protein